MTSDIKKEFFNFEKLYFKNDSFDNNNFFDILDYKEVNDLFLLNLKVNQLENEKLDKLFKKDIKFLIVFLQKKNLDFSTFSYFKSEYDVLNAYLLLFLIKTFSMKLKKGKKDHDFSTFSSSELLFDRDDFINTFSNFLFKFFLFCEIQFSTPFNFSKQNFRKFIYRYLELCVKEKLITMKDVKIENRNYKLLNFTLFIIPYKPDIVFYTKKFNFYAKSTTESYLYNSHFSSIVQITKQAKYSTAHFKIPKEHIDSLFERSIYIDRTRLVENFNWLLKDQNFNINTNLLEVNKNLSEKIEKFTIENDLGSLRFFHSKMSKLQTLIRIETILTMNFDNIELFLPFMFCSRGRIYELSDISFTFYKEFRYCAYSGIYKNENEKFHPINAQILITIKKQFYLFEKFEWFKDFSEIRKHTCVWVFVSVGALKKTELNENGGLHISTLILKGLEMWKNRNYENFEDIYDMIEFHYLLNLINELVTVKENLKKWIFWKDAPASCFQHQLLILGAKSEDSYKICNLNSTDTLYDPYTFLIKNFFEENCDKITKNLYTKTNLMLTKSKYFEIFSRKRLKKVFMTESYGAGYKKLSTFFTLNLNLENCSKEEKIAILQIWKEFFNYMSDNNPLFLHSSKEIINHFVNNNLTAVINPDKTEVDYSCFEIEITQFEVYIEKKRRTLQNRNITTIRDDDQFKTSIRANFVHTQDAVLARKYVLITKMWSIHDCFSIDFLNITYMVALINDLMNGEFFDLKINQNEKKIIFSIFIIL